MSYSVRLSAEVKAKISRWRLSSHAVREVLKGLDALGAKPSGSLIRVGPPDDALQYDLVIRNPREPGRDFLVTFTVRYGADEESLFIVECDRIVDDDPIG